MKYLASSAFRPVLTKTVWLVNKHDVTMMHAMCVHTRKTAIKKTVNPIESRT